MEDRQSVQQSIVVPELYFLISKFLSGGPLKETAKVLVRELEANKILPKRIDWTGVEHEQSLQELEQKYPHIGPNHLLEICSRIGPILDKELAPSVVGVMSMLGCGRQSLLRTKDSICRPRNLMDYCTRLHDMPLPDSASCKPNHNLLKVLVGRETGGQMKRKLFVPTNFYSKTQLLRRTLGHLSAVYCVLFDRSGRYIITGADDLLVKLWSAIDGRLLATFRGASAEITDIAINLDNTLLAAGSLDRILRVWDLQSTGPIAVLPGHTGMITSVNFCPSPRGDLKYLVTTSTDGSVAFWQYTTPRGAKTVFAPKPIQYMEKLRPGQAQMICASFSPGGIFLAAGSADHHVRVYIMLEEGPKRILEVESHTDAVDSIQWAHRGLKFISGSKDGTALVWAFESQQWRSLKLNMADRLSSCPEPPDDGKKLKVTMVSWDLSDKWVVTAVNDCSIKIWDAKSGRLHKVLRGHQDEIYVLESHPKDEHILLSAGHDGQLILWDIVEGISVAHFINNIDGQGHGGVFDAKWSPDGTMIAATDSHGHIIMFGFGAGHERFKILPRELFFHTDYRPLIRDANHLVMDEQTQMVPHLMPPPFLVDVDGNPHPPEFQRFVPGREHCPNDQLIPNIAVGPEGVEVLDQAHVSHIDRLIQALANRQGQEQAPDSNNEREIAGVGHVLNRPNGSPRSASSSNLRAGLRRTGDIEGVRQSIGNWQGEACFKWIRRIYVRPMKYAQLQCFKQKAYAKGQEEHEIYRREMRRRPIMITTGGIKPSQGAFTKKGRGGPRPPKGPEPAYRTRAVREREHVDEPPEEEEDSAGSSSNDWSFSTPGNENGESSTSDTESSDYSDWVADKPGPNLEPPKRSKRKPVERRNFSPSSDVTQQAGPSGISQPSTSTAAAAGGSSSPAARRRKIAIPSEYSEIPEAFKPPEWLSEVIPRKAPYYPQMGDEIVYFRQGHQRYLEAVREKKVYKLTNSSEPWNSLELRDHELVRVIGIKYEIRPPRLCCLKLAIINREGKMMDRAFTIKYHDMPDVLDFLVLRQTFDTAVFRNWSPGDRFRCMIGDGWWMGQIESRLPLSSEFPDSLFMCFRVRWDNGEYEYMSPWDMEPIDESRLPDEVGGAVSVLPEEIRATLYQPKSEEWPRGDRDASCRRIINGLEQVMGLAIADLFLAPVDLNIYPAYAIAVEYPIDLTTIKARFENHFYRRITSAQFDVRYLATNAEKFNESHSNIVKYARIVTDLCLRIIREPNDVDVGAVYHQLVATYISSDSENENDNEPGPSTSTAATTTKRPSKKNVSRRSKRLHSIKDWRLHCRELLELIWHCDDSSPFREPVDTLEHPDYLQIVDTPMDLRTIKEDLLGGNYESPPDFAKDMRLIFQNSKNYNTNKRSRIYSMTLRLSTLFETQFREVMYNWKVARRRESKTKGKPSPQKRNQPGPSKAANRVDRTNGTGEGSSRQHENSSEASDDDDDDPRPGPSGLSSRTRNVRVASRRIGTSNMNGVTSSVAAEASEPTPGPSGRGVRRNASRPQSQEEGHTESTSSISSSSSDDDSEESRGILVTELGRGRPRKHRNDDDNSEDSYKPNRPTPKKKITQRKNQMESETKRSGEKKTPKKIRNAVSVSPDHEEETRNVATTARSRRKKDSTTEDDDLLSAATNNSSATSATSEDSNDNPRKKALRRGAKARQSESRKMKRKRKTTEESDQPQTSRSRTNKSVRRQENDDSYHSAQRSSRRMMLESDTEQETSRPTRASVRRANLGWGREEDSLEPDHDDEVEIPRSPKKPQQKQVGRKRNSESEISPEDTNVPSSSLATILEASESRPGRQLRTNRNSRVVPELESDDEPILRRQPSHSSSSRQQTVADQNQLQPQSRSNRLARTFGQFPTQNGAHFHRVLRFNSSTAVVTRRPAPVSSLPTATVTSSSAVTRSHANSSTSSSRTGVTPVLQNNAFRSHIQDEHDYHQPGPSTVRNTRRMLSRHQRNADELDPLADVPDPLDLQSTSLENISSRLRMRNNPINSTTNENTSSPPPTLPTTNDNRPRRIRNNRPRYTDYDDEEIDVVTVAHETRRNHRAPIPPVPAETTPLPRTKTQRRSETSTTDSEDNQPLRFMAAASSINAAAGLSRRNVRNLPPILQPERNEPGTSQSSLSSQDGGTRNMRRQPKRRYVSEDEDGDEDYVNNRPTQSRRQKKRMHYNEDTDDSEPLARTRQTIIRGPSQRSPTSPSTRASRTSAAAAVASILPDNPLESDNDGIAAEDYEEEEQQISISSRGRVRKITAKARARGLFRE